MRTDVSIQPIRDLLCDIYAGRILPARDAQPADISLAMAAGLLHSIQHGMPIGMLTFSRTPDDNGAQRHVIDGHLRLAVLAGAFLPDHQRPAWAPPHLGRLAFHGLDTGDVRLGEASPGDPCSLPTWSLLNTMDFLRWERALHRAVDSDTRQTVTHVAENLARMLAATIPIVVCEGTTLELRAVRGRVNSFLG
ncbi:hypothetical protein [Micromonospora haikouensis]|uniref:hypothetical protein n=1 Tax=Micromonospora haikouensis TaxID=686309 RepID=UPI003D748746